MEINRLLENGTIIFSELNEKQKEEVKTSVCVENKGLIISLLRFQQIRTEDYIQEGFIGLLTALERYDYKKGFKFSSYAYFWINQRIKDSYRRNFMIKLPANSKKERKYVDLCEEQVEGIVDSFEDDCIFEIVVDEFLDTLNGEDKILFSEIFLEKVKVRPYLVEKYKVSSTTIYKQRQNLQIKFEKFLKKKGLR